MQNRVVIRFQDGRILKGFTSDFMAGRNIFHVTLSGAHSDKPVEVFVPALKAVFFVKDLVGNAEHQEKNSFDSSKPAAGRKISVQFKDGECIVGITQGYMPGRPGFFMVPADPLSNNERIYIVCSAAQEIKFL